MKDPEGGRHPTGMTTRWLDDGDWMVVADALPTASVVLSDARIELTTRGGGHAVDVPAGLEPSLASVHFENGRLHIRVPRRT